ncbi:hypothetical protein ACROYT_G017064 [Oculina patagonica]
MAKRDGKEEQLEQEVESQRRKENKPDESQEGKRRLSAPSCSAPNPKRAHLTTVGKTENGNNKEDGTQDCNSNPPRLNFEVPKSSDLPKACSKSWNDVELPVDFLLLTVEDCEFLGFFPYLEEPFKSYRKDIGYVWFGCMGSTVGSTKKLKIALMKCSKGSAVPGGSLTVVKNAVKVLKPKSVFSVGACSGLNRVKIKSGDVVVSSKLITPTHKTPASRDIGTLIRHAADGWKAPLSNPDAMEVRVHCDGAVLSSPEVISEDLIQQYPEAIAVDTEGEGVFAAAHDLKTEWVVVKGIKDYADGSQPSSDEWRRFASVMAASVVANILSDPVVFEEWSNYNQEASPVDTFNVKTCQRKPKGHHQKTATRMSWVKDEQTLAGSSQTELSHYTDLFTEKTKNGAVPKRVLVQGETGIGKTTFVKRLLVDWSNLEEAKMDEKRNDVLRKFELVLSINLKEVSKCQTLREVISHSLLLPRDEESSIDDLLCHVQKHQEKVLVVFDGYDEYRTSSEAEEKYGSRSSSPIYEVLQGNILRDCTVLVTTRPSRADEIRGPADIQAEITGFSMSDRKEFMRRMLESETQVDGLLRFLWKRKMEDLARVPLLTLYFCLLWKEEKEKLMELTESKTKLFRTILKHVLQHSHRKHSPVHFSKLKEADYEEVLAEIGKVALAGLLKGDLMFEFGQLPEKVRSEESVIVGLLQVSEYGPSLEPKDMVSFIHKSIQEYLAAWYITYRCVPEGSLGGIEQRTHSLHDCKALENVFQFLCGLSDEGAVKVFQHLKSVRISDPTLDLPTNLPLCDVTNRHWLFSDLVYSCFQEVHSKAELLSLCFNCTGRMVLVTKRVTELLQKAKVKDLSQVTYFGIFSFFRNRMERFYFRFSHSKKGSMLYMLKLIEVLDCLHVPLKITEVSEVVTVGDFVRKFQNIHVRGYCFCLFSSILCFCNGQFQFYINGLELHCDAHAGLFTETDADSIRPVSEKSCSEKSCLKFLRSLVCSNHLSSKQWKGLSTFTRKCEHLNKIEVPVCDDSVCDLLEQVPNPSKCSLKIGSSSIPNPFLERDSRCHLTSAGAVKLARLLPRFDNIIILNLDLIDCCVESVDTLVTSITHKTLKRLVLSGISLTPAVAVALGQSLPEMSSLQELELTGVDGSILQAKEMEALFGGFNKTLTLSELTFSGFSVRGSLAPLTKSFRFFPNLSKLELTMLNVDEHDQCCLLESIRLFVSNVKEIRVQVKSLGRAHCSTEEVYLSHAIDNKLNLNISLTPAVAATLGRLLPEMSSLQVLELTGVNTSILQAEDIKMLFGGFNKTLPLYKLTFSGFSLRGCLAPLTNCFCFFPNLRELELGELNGEFSLDEHNLCGLLESIRTVPNLMKLKEHGKSQSHTDCFTAEVNTVCETLRELHLDGISLTPAAAAALGQVLPEMPFLQTLNLTGVDGRTVQAEEMEALFGGFNKRLPLYRLIFSGFSVRGCLTPLTKSFRFLPNLSQLFFGELNMDEQDMRLLLESLLSIPNQLIVSLSGNGLIGTVPLTIRRGHPLAIVEFLDLHSCSQEDFDYVKRAFREVLPQVVIRY